MKTKICRICTKEIDIINFPKRKDAKDGYRNECKECYNKARKELYLSNIEHEKDVRKKYYINNIEKIKEKNKEYVKKNEEHLKKYRREYYEKNKEKISEQKKKYAKQHQKEITLKRKEKRHNDEKYYYEIYLRNKINNYLYRYGKIKKKNNVQEILGCSYEYFKKYIESKFVDGMSWENRGKWHLDHIIPLASAKNYDDLVRLNHYTNFQPLWAYDNYKKGKNIKGEYV